MNYTENYHLPQWDETDRILRRDFNNAMANLENGLTDNRNTSAEREDALERLTYDRFCRMAYNQFQAAIAMGQIPERLDMFYQDTSQSAEGLTGMVKLNDHYVICNGQGFSATDMHRMLKEVAPMTMGEDGPQPLRIEFVPTAVGLVSRLVFFFSITEGNVSELQFRLEYNDLTSGKIAWSKDITMPLSSKGAVLDLRDIVYVHINHKYEITLTPLQNTVTATGTLYKEITPIAGSLVTGPDATAVHTFANPMENSGALVAVNCDRYGDSEDPVLLWNGEEVPLWRVRTQSGGDDGQVRELLFRREKPVTSGDTAMLKMHCGEGGGEVHLYDWGAVLL